MVGVTSSPLTLKRPLRPLFSAPMSRSAVVTLQELYFGFVRLPDNKFSGAYREIGCCEPLCDICGGQVDRFDDDQGYWGYCWKQADGDAWSWQYVENSCLGCAAYSVAISHVLTFLRVRIPPADIEALKLVSIPNTIIQDESKALRIDATVSEPYSSQFVAHSSSLAWWYVH
jgi:hypothetical protein